MIAAYRIHDNGKECLAVIVEGRKWARVTTFRKSRRMLKSALETLRPERLDEATEKALIERLGGETK